MNAPIQTGRPWIGGSDVAAIVGVSKWRTPVGLYYEKRAAVLGEAPPADEDATGVKARGKFYEPMAREGFLEVLRAEGFEFRVEHTNARYLDAACPWMSAEIDFELVVDGLGQCNGEIKTADPWTMKNWGEAGSDEVPNYYAAQAQWGMMLTSADVCLFGVAFGFNIVPYVVRRDQQVIDWLRAAAVQFWEQHVLTGTPPAPLISADLERLWPRETGKDALVVADDRVAALALRHRALRSQVRAAEDEMESLEFEIQRFMGEAAILAVGPEQVPLFTWTQQSGKYLDQEALKADCPSIVKQHQATWTRRVFRAKDVRDLKGVVA